MEYNNKNSKNDDNDLCFIPLNIKQELSPINSSFPLLMNLDSLSLSLNTNSAFVTLPSPTTNMQSITKAPIVPYPDDIPDMYKYNDINTSEEENLEYPDEVNSDDLYSYNEARFNEDYLTNYVNHLDILKNFDLTPDTSEYRQNVDSETIDKVFDSIEKNNPGIFATLKTYRIPYPIAKLLVKKIISLTLKYN